VTGLLHVHRKENDYRKALKWNLSSTWKEEGKVQLVSTAIYVLLTVSSCAILFTTRETFMLRLLDTFSIEVSIEDSKELLTSERKLLPYKLSETCNDEHTHDTSIAYQNE
jgi:hypothetical protein